MSTATHSPSAIALFFGLFLALVVACGGPSQPASGPEARADVSVPAAADGGGLVALDGGPSAPEQKPVVDAGPQGGSFASTARLCGCKLCEPKISDDACSTDADCAPSSPCHATACIAASRVVAPANRTMCTHIMMCGTTDANPCTCYQGKCALTPRP